MNIYFGQIVRRIIQGFFHIFFDDFYVLMTFFYLFLVKLKLYLTHLRLGR